MVGTLTSLPGGQVVGWINAETGTVPCMRRPGGEADWESLGPPGPEARRKNGRATMRNRDDLCAAHRSSLLRIVFP